MPGKLQYDPDAAHKLVGRLNRRAILVLVLWPGIGALAGGAGGFEIAENLGAVIGAAVGAYLGYLLGSMRSMYYEVQAQTLLWQRLLEERTRTKTNEELPRTSGPGSAELR